MPASCLSDYSCLTSPNNIIDAWNTYIPELSFSSLLVIMMTIVGVRLILRSESIGIVVPFYFGFILIFSLGSLIATPDLDYIFSINGIILMIAVVVSGVAIYRGFKIVG